MGGGLSSLKRPSRREKTLWSIEARFLSRPQQIGAKCQARSKADKNGKISPVGVVFPKGQIKGERKESGGVIPIFSNRYDQLILYRSIEEFQHDVYKLLAG